MKTLKNGKLRIALRMGISALVLAIPTPGLTASSNEPLQLDVSVGMANYTQKKPVPAFQGRVGLNDSSKNMSMEFEGKTRIERQSDLTLTPLSINLDPETSKKYDIFKKLEFVRLNQHRNALLGTDSKNRSILYLSVEKDPKPAKSGAVFETGFEFASSGELQLAEDERPLHTQSVMGLDRLIIGGQIANPKGEEAPIHSLRITAGTRDMSILEKAKCIDDRGRLLYDLAYSQYDLFAQLEAHFQSGFYAQAEVGTEVRVISDSPDRDILPATGSKSAPYAGINAGFRF